MTYLKEHIPLSTFSTKDNNKVQDSQYQGSIQLLIPREFRSSPTSRRCGHPYNENYQPQKEATLNNESNRRILEHILFPA